MNKKIKLIKNERGITLVELLAAILLFFTFIGIIYAVLIQSTDLFHSESGQIQLQQKANTIEAQLDRYYRKNGAFSVTQTADSVVISSNGEQRKYSIPGYSIQITSTDKNNTTYQSKVVTITLRGANTYKYTTTLSRLNEVNQ
ncbi:hypothetical protein CN692_23195 [Bacillus sp. AFS002410]|uniref:type II secretion system protein n=1 Tax=Bacillus sp. AFS002410 TaxID=2033481 RepID=UPI000BEF953D|nr:type II secretion system protein [Bacillus sp. AFS002410]PEJ49354.1 hypothetical protein CN692_23195 [Bacillus sp. AFS002410]